VLYDLNFNDALAFVYLTSWSRSANHKLANVSGKTPYTRACVSIRSNAKLGYVDLAGDEFREQQIAGLA
jgi:hypothetical protein